MGTHDRLSRIHDLSLEVLLCISKSDSKDGKFERDDLRVHNLQDAKNESETSAILPISPGNKAPRMHKVA